MKKIRAFLITLILALSLTVPLAASAVDSATYTGNLNGAPYKIMVPANWNGTLLVSSHSYGYMVEKPLAQWFDYTHPEAAPGGAAYEEGLLAQGYALAGTSFRGAYWQVKEGTSDLMALVGLFKDTFGKPNKTILVGYSMGSLIALKSAEEVQIYDGVILGGTIGAGTSRLFDIVGDFALGYDTLFGWPASWGTFDNVRAGLDFNTEVMPVVMGQLMNPANIGKFEFLRLFAGLDKLTAEEFYQNPGFLFQVMFFTTQGRAELQARAKGPISQNTDHFFAMNPYDKGYLAYLGMDADAVLAAMNSRTNIAIAKPQSTYLSHNFDPTGGINVPVMSLHTNRDGLIAPYHETVLLETIKAAGKEDLFFQMYTEGSGHAVFTPQQLLQTIHAMESWIDSGVKPVKDYFPPSMGFLPDFVPPQWPVGKK